MKMSLYEYIKKWIIKANNDITVAEREITYRDAVTDAIAFHYQQAAEKYLKAFLIFKNYDFEKTHNLKELLNQCSNFDKDFCNIDIKDLNMYAVDGRYPDYFYMPTIDEAKEYLDITRIIKELVENKLNIVLQNC